MRERYNLFAVDKPGLLTASEIVERCQQHDASVLACTAGDHLGQDVLNVLSPSVRLIANYGAGTDNIDIARAAARQIVVSNTPDVVTTCTADLAMGLIIAACRDFQRAERILRAGDWHGFALTDYFGGRLASQTLGIVGLGRIGRAVATRARAFDMKIVYNTPRRDHEFERLVQATYAADLDALLSTADVVSLHCPLTDQTRHMLDAAALSTIRKGSILVNTARGALVDEQALIAALQSGHLAAAGLDVYENEPKVSAKLRTMPQVTLLPHIGTATKQSRVEMGMRVVENIDVFLQTGAVRDPVMPAAGVGNQDHTREDRA